MNAKQRKTLQRSPETVQKLLKYLPAGWSAKPVQAITMGWSAELMFKELQFALAEHKLYLELFVKKNGKWLTIQTPENASVEQLAELLQQEAAGLLEKKNL